MKILSIDTAMAACSAAVLDTGAGLPLATACVPMERGHAEALPPMVAMVMEASGLQIAEIDRIIVTTGPGTFTGVRIGLAYARGLGLARGIPVIGVDSLTAIAANEEARAPLLVVSDARNAEVYAAVFDAHRRLISGPHVTTASAAAADLPSESLVLGTAAEGVMAAAQRNDLVRSHAGDLPVAAHFARLAPDIRPGDMPAPLYLRPPDAKPQTAQLRKFGKLKFEDVGVAASRLLSEMHADIFDEGWSATSFAEMLGTPGTHAAIASDGGEPLGFIISRLAADEAEIISIGSRSNVQRRGVARQLLERQIALLAAEGVRLLFLEVAASNAAAQRLYAGCGFTEAGRRKGYYKRDGGAEDAIVLRRELRP